MANLRIVNSNLTPYATLTSDNTEVLELDNVKDNSKSNIWRNDDIVSETITATFATTVPVSMVSFVYCNFSSQSTMQVKMYDTGGTNLLHTTAITQCVPPVDFTDVDWGSDPLGINAFAYGGGVYSTIWLPEHLVDKIEITIVDTNNNVAYLEAGILVIGRYWSPDINASYGAEINNLDLSKAIKNEAGDIIIDRGPTGKTMTFSLEHLDKDNRIKVMNMIKNNGRSTPLFLNLYPDIADNLLEQESQIYGFLSNGDIRNSYYLNFEYNVSIEEV